MSDVIEKQTYEGWSIIELMGHRRLAGYVRQVELFGAPMLRLDVPAAEGQAEATQFYGGASIYCLTPCSEETALAVARGVRPAPVHRWELPAPKPSSPIRQDDDDDDDEEDDGLRYDLDRHAALDDGAP